MGTGIAMTVLGVAAMLVADRGGRSWAVSMAKPLASLGFLVVWWEAGPVDSTFRALVGAALCASWVGDVALLSDRSRPFLIGLVSFALAHVAYAAAFLGLGVAWTAAGVALAVLAIPAWAVDRWLHPKVPAELATPVRVYIGLISIMVALSIGAAAAGGSPLLVAAAATFYVSDLSVARDRFIAPGPANRLWGWPLYYGAQLMFAMM